jgi:hypothetical protein
LSDETTAEDSSTHSNNNEQAVPQQEDLQATEMPLSMKFKGDVILSPTSTDEIQ